VRRREFITLLGGAAIARPHWARAQAPTLPVVGLMGGTSAVEAGQSVAAFRQGLKETGYIEGQNVAIEYRWAEGQYDRLPALAADLVNRPVAVLVSTGGDVGALASKRATSTIPIVFIIGADPVKLGLVRSLDYPGLNATGMELFVSVLSSKRLQLLLSLVSRGGPIGVLANPKNPNFDSNTKELKEAARALRREVEIFSASTVDEIDAAFAAMAAQKVPAIVVNTDPFYLTQRRRLADLAARYALPAIYSLREHAAAGGLLSYGTSIVDAYHQVGIYTGRILKGEKPASLPVLQPTKFELVINLKAAKALGLEIPARVLAVAYEVID
jgi:putative ABC transport system substrate-binding protein